MSGLGGAEPSLLPTPGKRDPQSVRHPWPSECAVVDRKAGCRASGANFWLSRLCKAVGLQFQMHNGRLVTAHYILQPDQPVTRFGQSLWQVIGLPDMTGFDTDAIASVGVARGGGLGVPALT